MRGKLLGLSRTEGHRYGQDHPRAKYTDREVELVAELAREGMVSRRIAQAMDMPRRTVRDILSGRIRPYQSGGGVESPRCPRVMRAG